MARVVPVILLHCDWHCAPFACLQALPTDGKPIASRRNRDAAWLEVATGIRLTVQELQAGRTQSSRGRGRVPVPAPALSPMPGGGTGRRRVQSTSAATAATDMLHSPVRPRPQRRRIIAPAAPIVDE